MVTFYIGYEESTLIVIISVKNAKAGIELFIRDAVDFHEDLYVLEMVVWNLTAKYRLPDIFLSRLQNLLRRFRRYCVL